MLDQQPHVRQIERLCGDPEGRGALLGQPLAPHVGDVGIFCRRQIRIGAARDQLAGERQTVERVTRNETWIVDACVRPTRVGDLMQRGPPLRVRIRVGPLLEQ